KAHQLDPFEVNIDSWLGTILYDAGRYDEAIAQHQKTIELYPHTAPVQLAETLRQAYASSGYNGYLKKRIEHMISTSARGSEPASSLAQLYATLGDKD